MIEYIGVKNFKTLLNTTFPLAQLNIFSGLNGMGKSSLIQTLLLLRQSHEKNTLCKKGLLLNGEYIDLGTGRDILSVDSEIETISFIIKWRDLKKSTTFDFDYKKDSDLLPLQALLDSSSFESLSLFNQKFRYLSANRLEPRSQHALSEFHIQDLNSLGKHGEYTVHYIAANGRKELKIPSLKHPKTNMDTLLANIEAWMSDISPGLKVRAISQPELNATTLSFSFIQGNDRTAEFKPQNVGFGLSYVLPIVTSILSAEKDDLLIIENPESHLHPAGQSIMGKLCGLAANHGVQLIIESHSDHFLNGVRVAVKEKVISPDKVQLFFLQREINAHTHASDVVNPKLDEKGRINQWPAGFFDEWDNQLDRLL